MFVKKPILIVPKRKIVIHTTETVILYESQLAWTKVNRIKVNLTLCPIFHTSDLSGQIQIISWYKYCSLEKSSANCWKKHKTCLINNTEHKWTQTQRSFCPKNTEIPNNWFESPKQTHAWWIIGVLSAAGYPLMVHNGRG